MRVAAFTKYDSLAAGTRQRLLQYVPALEAAGITVDYHPLLGQDYVRNLATGEGFSRAQLAASYLRRMRQLAFGARADLLWIHFELFPYLPAGFEMLAFRRGRPVVFDFDDAFFHEYDDSRRSRIRASVSGKFGAMLRRAAACCCGNEYVRERAAAFCDNSIILPTVVDTDLYCAAPRPSNAPVTVGWIGSPSTWPYLRPLVPLLAELCAEMGIEIRVVGAGAKAEADRFPGLHLIEWTEDTEIREVQAMDIGIMPLPDQPWTRGKSGYKLIQYMACGLPVVASPVGVNSEIVKVGVNGFLAGGIDEWRSALTRLIKDPALRKQFGSSGRNRAEDLYSLKVHAPRLVHLFKSLQGISRR